MRKITLGELLQYYDMEEKPVDRIQIVTGDRDWEFADELFVNSELIVPFMDWEVAEMSHEKTYGDKQPVGRVAIKPRI